MDMNKEMKIKGLQKRGHGGGMGRDKMMDRGRWKCGGLERR